MKNNWFITEISRGFGLALAEELIAQGCRVVGTTRDGTSPLTHPNLAEVRLNVTVEAQAGAALERAKAFLGSIDVIVNNAGHGMIGAVEEVSDVEARRVFDTMYSAR